ncbi:MAG TPA: type II secretion system protein, partial [Verrucomicrobiae bacterium]|nr:type II secretion system protein [Verrucomicrobiae bacterium]
MRKVRPMITSLDSHREPAFTLIELLTTLGVVALLLACVLVPAKAGNSSSGPAAQCMENNRRLEAAWSMYAADNQDNLARNLQGGMAQGGNSPPNLGPGWAAGWLDWTTGGDNTNLLFLINTRYAALGPYAGNAPALYKCPADTYLSPAQKARGWTSRARSYSLSVGLGQGNAEAGAWDPIYRHVTKLTGFLYPAPAQTFVFIDEDADSINDPAFYSPNSASILDIPAARHNAACPLSFADGHAAFHKWNRGENSKIDLHWLSSHTQRISDSAY